MKKRFLIFTVILVIFITPLLSSCAEYDEEKQKNLEYTQNMLDKIAKNDIDSALSYVNQKFISPADFRTMAGYISDFLNGSSDYEITPLKWNRKVGNSNTDGKAYDTFTVTYRITSEKSTPFILTVLIADGENGVCAMSIEDATFVYQKEAELRGLDIMLTIYNVACIALTVVMFIHCCRSKILHKRRWAIFTLVGGYVRFTLLIKGINFSFMLSILNNSSGVVGDIANNAIAITVGVPVGAIVYLINKNKLKTIQPPPPAPYPDEFNNGCNGGFYNTLDNNFYNVVVKQ